MDNIKKLEQVYQALDQVTVRGFSNIYAMAGAGQILDDVIRSMRTQAEEAKVKACVQNDG